MNRSNLLFAITIILGWGSLDAFSAEDLLQVSNKPALPYVFEANIDRDKFNEPSGITYHQARGTLFVVDDNGGVEEISCTGEQVNIRLFKKGEIEASPNLLDFEGITNDPRSGLVYVAIEGAETIIELNPGTFDLLRAFKLPRTYNGKTILKEGGNGLESLCFVPDANHPEGGTFFATNQALDLDLMQEGDGSLLIEFEAPLQSGSGKISEARLLRVVEMPVIDLAGMHYNHDKNTLYIVSDKLNLCLEVSREGKILKPYTFPGDDQEGIAIDDEGNLYIAQDSGGIIKYVPSDKAVQK